MKTSDFSWLFNGVTKDEISLDNLLAEISITIIKEMYDMGVSQKEFSDLLGISQVEILEIENLEYNPSIKTLFHICTKLNLNLSVDIN